MVAAGACDCCDGAVDGVDEGEDVALGAEVEEGEDVALEEAVGVEVAGVDEGEEAVCVL